MVVDVLDRLGVEELVRGQPAVTRGSGVKEASQTFFLIDSVQNARL